ncbi:MAG: AI-2E family transporter [Gammaproteobacteria bacterium]
MTDSDKQNHTDQVRQSGEIIFDRKLLFKAFFFTVFLYLLYQLALILSPFLAPLLSALMITLIFFPLHAKILSWVRYTNLGAVVSTITVLLTIVVPILILMWILIDEAGELLPLVREWVAERGNNQSGDIGSEIPLPLQELWERMRPYIDKWNIDLQSMAIESVRDLGNTITSLGAATLRGTLTLLINIIVLIIVLFFFFRDGKEIIKRIIDLVPMEEHNKQLILSRLDKTLVAVIRGAFITSSVQGLLTGIGLAVAGVPFAVLLGFTAALLSVVPFVGASLVWGPASIYLLVNGQIIAGIGLIFWGMLVVGLVDNFLRPWVVGRHAQLPILLLLVGILGGLQVYGLIGALISPLVVVGVIVFAQIYHDQYLSGHPAETTETTTENATEREV